MNKQRMMSFRVCTWLDWQTHRHINVLMDELKFTRSAAVGYLVRSAIRRNREVNPAFDRACADVDQECRESFPSAWAKHLAYQAVDKGIDKERTADIPC